MFNQVALMLAVCTSVVIFSANCAESIATDIKQDVVSNATWTKDYDTAFEKARTTGYPVLTFWASPYDSVSRWARTAINTTEFRSFIKKHNVYLVYASFFDEHNIRDLKVIRFYKQLFTSVDSTYDGFPDGSSSESPANTLPLPSFTLNTVDSGKTNFMFHIVRNWHNTDQNGLFSPYADSITWNGNLYLEDDAPEGYKFNIIKVLEEYLDGKTPAPVNTSTEPGVESTSPTPVVMLDNVASRFVISVRDILVEAPFESSGLASDFDVIAKAGTWFVDRDSRLRAVNANTTASSDGTSWIQLRAKSSGMLYISSHEGNPVSVKPTTGYTLSAHVASDAVSMDADGNLMTNGTTSVSTTYDGTTFVAVNTNVVLTAGQVIELRGKSGVVCETFAFRRL